VWAVLLFSFSLAESHIEDEVLEEVLNEPRGERDEPGVRDEWEKKVGVGVKQDVRSVPTKQSDLVTKLLRLPLKQLVSMVDSKGLGCPGCTSKKDYARRLLSADDDGDRDQGEDTWRDFAWAWVVYLAFHVGPFTTLVIAVSAFLLLRECKMFVCGQGSYKRVSRHKKKTAKKPSKRAD
jgi:hypothetical protein